MKWNESEEEDIEVNLFMIRFVCGRSGMDVLM